MIRVRDEVSPLHPALPGHFPGNPIVPGVVILSQVCRAASAALGAAVTAVPAVKFHAPLRPAEAFDIEVEPADAGSAGFRVVREEMLIAAGILRFSER